MPLAAFHEIVGDAPDADAECARYTALLREHELDLCCMGIGENGHLAFNDPPVADFDDPVDVKVVELDEASRQQQVNEGHFAAIDDVPTQAITVTIPPLLRAGAALAIVPEARKREPVTTALTGPRVDGVPCVGPAHPQQRDAVPRRGVGRGPSGPAVKNPVRRRPTAPASELEVVSFPSVAELRRRMPRLLAGIVILSFGIALMIDARLGVSPYDVLHQGIADNTGLSFGTVVVLLGIAILVVWIPLGQRFGIGTVINTLTIGFITDAFIRLVGEPASLVERWPMLVGGILVTAFGMALYIGAGLGPGPRDGLMTGIAAKGYPLWAVRTALELTALVAGWLLGGDVGVGTVLFAAGIGPLGHWFLARLHLGADGVDPDPTATFGE